MSSHSGTWKKTVFTYGIILLGSGILSFGLYNIHERTNVTEGGVLGMTLLLQHWFGFSPSVTSPLMDIACYLLAWRFLGNAFARYAPTAERGKKLYLPTESSYWARASCPSGSTTSMSAPTSPREVCWA